MLFIGKHFTWEGVRLIRLVRFVIVRIKLLGQKLKILPKKLGYLRKSESDWKTERSLYDIKDHKII